MKSIRGSQNPILFVQLVASANGIFRFSPHYPKFEVLSKNIARDGESSTVSSLHIKIANILCRLQIYLDTYSTPFKLSNSARPTDHPRRSSRGSLYLSSPPAEITYGARLFKPCFVPSKMDTSWLKHLSMPQDSLSSQNRSVSLLADIIFIVLCMLT